jgi:hypothetical protein
MRGRRLPTLDRRDLLRFVMATTAAATAPTVAVGTVTAEPIDGANKRKARYQAKSAEVQDFYRVNRYPTR